MISFGKEHYHLMKVQRSWSVIKPVHMGKAVFVRTRGGTKVKRAKSCYFQKGPARY